MLRPYHVRARAVWIFSLVAFQLSCVGACWAGEVVLRFAAQSFTPGISSGEGSRPLTEFARITKEWERLHPGVRIEFVRQPVGDYRTWMITQLKAGMAPDILCCDSRWANDGARYGWFVEMERYLDRPNPYVPGNRRWRDLFYSQWIDADRAPDGSLYVLPIDLNDTGIFYNRDIFRKLGLRPPRTWAEMIRTCQTIQEHGYVPFAMEAGQYGELSWARWILHDQLWTDRLPAIHVKRGRFAAHGVDAQEFVRAFKKGLWSLRDPRYRDMLRILKEWSVYWNGDAQSASASGERLFRAGRAAMYWSGSWFLPELKRDPLRTFAFGVSPVPKLTAETSRFASGAGARSVGGSGATQYAITNTAVTHGTVDLAFDFLMFVTAPGQLGPLVREAGMSVPNSPGVRGDPVLAPFVESLFAGHTRFDGEPSDKQYDEQAFRVLQGYLGGRYTEDEAIARQEVLLRAAVERLLLANPQWRFNRDWNILPDGPRPPAASSRPPFAFLCGVWILIVGLPVGCGVRLLWRRRDGLWEEIRRKRFSYLLILPTLVLLLVFCDYPIFSAFYHAFFDWEGSGEATWAGLANFSELGRDAILGEASLNLLKLLIVGVLVSLTVPLVVAEMIFHLRSARAQYVYRVLFVVPMVVPGVVVLLIWGFLYDYDLGLINHALTAVGLGRFTHAWLGDPRTALYALMFIGFPWVGGFALLVYYAGLQNISQEVLDAARVDGAVGLRRIWHVDLPLVQGQIKLLAMLGIIGGVQGFQTQLLLTQGGPGYSTTVPGLILYQNSMLYDRMGYACAIGVAMFLAISALTYLNNRYVKSYAEFEAR